MAGCKQRLQRVLAGAGLLLTAGAAYAALVRLTGLGLPCPVHALTGLYCPGCGVSRMCLSLLEGDLGAAWRANPLVLLLLPVLLGLLARQAARYVRTGEGSGSGGAETGWLGMASVLVVYGVLRNLPMFSFLAPG